MTDPKNQRSLLLAIDLATARRDAAQTQLQSTQQAEAFAQDQMQQLQQYAEETQQRWMQSAQVSASPEMLHHHYQFMSRLNQAVQLQDGVLASNRQRVEAARQVLLSAEFRLMSFKQVVATRQSSVNKARQRQEQKQMDEFASQQAQRRQRLHAENEI